MALARLLLLLLPAYGLEAEAQSLQLCALSTRRTLLLLLCNFATVHKIPTTKINSSWKELVPSSFLHFADLAWHNFWQHLEFLLESQTISESSVLAKNCVDSIASLMLWMLWILNMKHFCWISNTVSVYNFSLHHHHLIIRNLKIVMFFWTSPSSLFFQASRISHWTKLLLLLDSIFFLILLSKSS